MGLGLASPTPNPDFGLAHPNPNPIQPLTPHPTLTPNQVAEGEDVLQLDVVPAHFCILTHGSVAVVLSSGLCVARLNARPADATCRNPFFGEMGLLANKPAVASVRATSAVRCLTISRANFARFLGLVPDFEERVSEIGRARGRENDLKLKLEEAEASRANMLATDKAMEVLALPSMQQRERRRTDDDFSGGLASEAAAVLFTKKLQTRARRPPKGTL